MDGWIKYFFDRKPEHGSDQDVANKVASWSNGCLSNMTGVEIYHQGRKVITMGGLGVYHQSDDFDVSLLQSVPNLVTRRLQKQITPRDSFIVGYNYDCKSMELYTASENALFHKANYSIFTLIPRRHIGQWITAEYKIQYNEIAMFISEDKL
jgi:hypothetical protein